jgi:superfamily II DNA or RNA helicase
MTGRHRILSPGRIEAQFDPRTLYLAGQLLPKTNVRVSDEGRIVGESAGYTAYIHGDSNPSWWCDCRSGSPCAHLAAVLLKARGASAAGAGAWLSHDLRSWFDEADRASEGTSPAGVDDRDSPLSIGWSLRASSGHIYMLDRVQALFIKRKRDGTPYKRRTVFDHWDVSTIWDGNRMVSNPARAIDRSLVRMLKAGEEMGTWQLGSAAAGEVLAALCSTERLWWETLDGEPFRMGKTRSADFGWFPLPSGSSQSLGVRWDGRLAFVPSLPSPWFVDEQDRVIGPLKTNLSMEQLSWLYRIDFLNFEEILGFTEQVLRRPRLQWVPLPHGTKVQEVEAAPSGKLLRLERTSALAGNETVALPIIEYDSGPVNSTAEGGVTLRHSGGVIERVRRNPNVEAAILRDLEIAGLSPAPGRTARFTYVAPTGSSSFWLEFQRSFPETLGRLGWSLDIATGVPRLATAVVSDVTVALDADGTGWFDVAMGIEIDGKAVDVMPALFDLFRDPDVVGKLNMTSIPDSEVFYVNLGTRGHVPLPYGRLRTLYRAFADFSADSGEARVRIGRHQVALIPFLEEDEGIRLSGGASMREIADTLAKGPEPLPDLPELVSARLRPYQATGTQFLQLMRRCGFGAVLADDMGLGKTLQTLLHIWLEVRRSKDKLPSLVVTPKSIAAKWLVEIEKFLPGLRVQLLTGATRHGEMERVDKYDVVVTTYPLLVRDSDFYLGRNWRIVALDEAHHVRNRSTKGAQVASKLNAEQRIGLTGTALQNNLGELWSLFNFVAPGLLRSERWFRRNIRVPYERDSDMSRMHTLTRLIRPFTLRRTREEVAPELPPLTIVRRDVILGPAQRDLYEVFRAEQDRRLKEVLSTTTLQKAHIHVFTALLRLRQVCCDPRLLKSPHGVGVPSAKLEALIDLLLELRAENHRTLVFSQWTEMLDLIKPELDRVGITWTQIVGSQSDREGPQREFNSGRAEVMLNSLHAAGEGLDLQTADTVILFEPWWNPYAELQAIARAHRFGQEKPVFVYKLIVPGSVEERMLALHSRKQATFDAVLSGIPSEVERLSREEIDFLFAPLDALAESAADESIGS